VAGKPEENKQLGRLRCRCEGNVKIDIREVGYGGLDSTDLDEERGSCEHGNEYSYSIKQWEIPE
jgi:hypothetical protein